MELRHPKYVTALYSAKHDMTIEEVNRNEPNGVPRFSTVVTELIKLSSCQRGDRAGAEKSQYVSALYSAKHGMTIEEVNRNEPNGVPPLATVVTELIKLSSCQRGLELRHPRYVTALYSAKHDMTIEEVNRNEPDGVPPLATVVTELIKLSSCQRGDRAGAETSSICYCTLLCKT
ncbi:hypothetical protein J6590_022346 [Homalodisca vitripennis]|nr:hypothetical protein J6590_022346 [Homalodisca vitripennis]